MTARRSKRPLIGRLLIRLRRLGGRRGEIEDDLGELYDARLRDKNRRYARFRYVLDALSLWRWRIGAFAPPERSTQRFWRGHGLTQDVTFAVRMFARQPGIVLMTVAGLSLAIGLSTVILTIVNAVTMRSTGIHEPAALRSVEAVNLTRGRLVSGYSPLEGNWASADLERLARGVSSMELAADSPYTIPADLRRTADRSSTESVPVMPVSGGYFRVLGARTVLGRTLVPDDDTAAANHVAFLSHALWKVRFGRDPGIVGHTVWLDDVPFMVVGVAERGFVGTHGSKFQTAPALWVSFASQAAIWSERQRAANLRIAAEIARLSGQPSLDEISRTRLGALRASAAAAPARWNVPVDVVGRLQRDGSLVRAEAELTNVARALAAEGRRAGEREPAVRLGPVERPRTDPALTAIVGTVVAVLLALACSNVANLLVANAAGREREIGTRLALGACRGRMVRQLLTESVVLGACAGALGLLLSLWLSPLAAHVLSLPELIDLTPDLRVYALVAVITVATGVVAGLAPARYGWRGNLLSALQSERAGSSGGYARTRVRSILIGAQAAACIVLLVGAALLTRSAVAAAGFDTGVAIDRLVNITPELGRGYDRTRTRAYLTAALERIEQLPGVASASLAAVPPFHYFHATMAVTGSPLHPGPGRVQRNEVTADYFSTVGVRILAGRTFSDEEVQRQLPVAIISASLASQFWGDASPIGSTLDRVWGLPDTPAEMAGHVARKPAGTRVVGVASDSMTQIDDYDLPTIYLPLDIDNIVAHLVVSTDGDPKAVSAAISREVLALDPDQSPEVALPIDRLRSNLQASRSMASATSAIGASALVLAVIGLFGVTAFVVGQRRREISIRMALGATGRHVVRMLIRDSLRPVAIGLGFGLVVAFIAGQLMKTILLGVSGHDPVAILSAVALLAATAGLAAFVPSRRAAQIDPAGMLKQD